MQDENVFLAQGRLILYGVFKEKWARLIEDEIIYADKMFSGFLMGKLVDSLIIGVICFIGTYMMGIKSALLVSVVVGVTNIIPFSDRTLVQFHQLFGCFWKIRFMHFIF